MRKISVLVCVLMLASPASWSQIPGLGATEWTQLLNNVELVAQVANSAEQLVTELKAYKDMLLHGRLVRNWQWGFVNADLRQLADIIRGGQSIAYSMANLDQEFKRRYPGYGRVNGTYYNQYRSWSQTSMDTTQGVLRTAGLQGTQLDADIILVGQLKNLASTTGGRMEGIQVGLQIAEQNTEQLMRLRQLVLADINSKQIYQAQQIQREQAAAAAAENFWRFQPVSDRGNKAY